MNVINEITGLQRQRNPTIPISGFVYTEPGRFIGKWDDVGASFSQTDAWEPFSLRNTVKANDENNARLESLMSALPPQADGVARVFLQELFDDDVRDNDSTSGMDFPYKFPPLRIATVGFLSLISNQYWASPLRWHRIESFNFIASKRGSPQVRWVNVVRYLRFQVIDNRLQEFIMCRTLVRTDWTGNNRRFPEEQFRLYQATATFATQLCELDAMYRPFKNTSDWMKAFSLQFCHANLLLYAKFLLRHKKSSWIVHASIENVQYPDNNFDMEMNWTAMYSEEVAKRKQQLSTYVHFRILASILWWLGLGLFCIILVVSCLIGMFRDISLGAKVLGYGLAVVSFPAARKAAQESPRVERRRQGMGADEENASPVNPPEPTTRMTELASAAANHAESEDEVANE
ncbi:hypothetical protein CPAR01_05461 [Colletotrichum paranaense]|uniref:Uncharacterized protein n=1 Tax=Colletotrichum paranaense TaxID=1914294 RepID=A0ABQ9SRC3_9PEZI|nr:uncharacterized protein CPAR01_05461 [Colletotrichum paranaense]KAK1542074.1 hypothetical protein CPAR01_05461 [Colletotrichum paranaense]